jgi:hypothetical protein
MIGDHSGPVARCGRSIFTTTQPPSLSSSRSCMENMLDELKMEERRRSDCSDSRQNDLIGMCPSREHAEVRIHKLEFRRLWDIKFYQTNVIRLSTLHQGLQNYDCRPFIVTPLCRKGVNVNLTHQREASTINDNNVPAPTGSDTSPPNPARDTSLALMVNVESENEQAFGISPSSQPSSQFSFIAI